MGSDHHSSGIFPPPAQTIIGALRTAVLLQNDISYRDYYDNNVSSSILDAIGEAKNQEPFSLMGPLFIRERHFFIPAPFHWFYDKAEKNNRNVHVFRAETVKSRLIRSKKKDLLWATGEGGEMVSMGGRWIRLDDLFSTDESIEIFDSEYFFSVEERTGIALHRNRSVREGHLYTFNHVRLNPEVGMAFGVDVNLPLASAGFLKLGAEGRFGRYQRIKPPRITSGGSGRFVALGLVKGSQQPNQAIIATGKIQYIGGWDLKKGFHKPMQGYFPPGSVFNENIQKNLVQI